VIPGPRLLPADASRLCCASQSSQENLCRPPRKDVRCRGARSDLCSNRGMGVRRPEWWFYPERCANGHEWGPGLITVSWMPCDCPPALAAREHGPGHMVAIEEISRLVGHSSTLVTQTVYRHELRPVVTSGAEMMDRIFADGAK
jgi:hypothetical protein